MDKANITLDAVKLPHTLMKRRVSNKSSKSVMSEQVHS